MTIRQYKASDVLAMTLRPEDVRLRSIAGLPFERLLEAYKKGGPSATLEIDGVPVVSGGLFLYWGGVAEAWLFVDESAPTIVARSIKRWLDKWIDSLCLRRVEMLVRADYHKAARLAEYLGFRRESIKRQFCPDGQDAYQMVLLRN